MNNIGARTLKRLVVFVLEGNHCTPFFLCHIMPEWKFLSQKIPSNNQTLKFTEEFSFAKNQRPCNSYIPLLFVMCSYKHSNLLQDGRSYCVAPIVTPGTTRVVWRWKIRSLKRWTVAGRTVDIFDVYHLFSYYIQRIIWYYMIFIVVSFPVGSIVIQISHTPRVLECPYVIVVVHGRGHGAPAW